MYIPELIRRKREGGSLTREEISAFLEGYLRGDVEEYQVAAFLMAVFFRGMAPEEAAALALVMKESGEVFDLSGIDGPKVDKHSTGGVGDKVSLVLAPLVAEAGGIVPMVSGRGLGHTGGTLDKLEAILGYRWNLDQEAFRRQLARVGCAIIGQTDRFVPADKRLYALRDVTATVESVPLISGSILSKKAAAGTEYLAMDVKTGSGAFMETEDRARELAESLVRIGGEMGMRVSCLLTQMNQPLGVAVGNALETREAIDVLQGGGPADVRKVTVALGARMLVLAGLEKEEDKATVRLERLLDGGQALERFRQWVAAQGGDPRVADESTLMEVSGESEVLRAEGGGYLARMNVREIGVAANLLGAGRLRASDSVDLAVGIDVPAKIGDRIDAGQPLAVIHHRGGRGLAEARERLRQAISISEEAVTPLELVIGRVG